MMELLIGSNKGWYSVPIANSCNLQLPTNSPFPTFRRCHLNVTSLIDDVNFPPCSIRKFYDNGMRALFDVNNLWISDTNTTDTLLTGYRNPITKLYMIPLNQLTPSTVLRVSDPIPVLVLRGMSLIENR